MGLISMMIYKARAVPRRVITNQSVNPILTTKIYVIAIIEFSLLMTTTSICYYYNNFSEKSKLIDCVWCKQWKYKQKILKFCKIESSCNKLSSLI